MISVITVFFLLCTKHIIFDYFLQTSWMISEKGTYLKNGGVAHSGLHGLGTTFVLLVVSVASIPVAIFLGLLDFIAHYHIDYVKSNWMKKYNPDVNSSTYWVAHGFDQYLHLFTYYLIVLTI